MIFETDALLYKKMDYVKKAAVGAMGAAFIATGLAIASQPAIAPMTDAEYFRLFS